MPPNPTDQRAPFPTPAGTTCITCNYDLATLGTSCPCPECGTPIENSLKGPLLRFAPLDTRHAADRASFILRLSLRILIYSTICVLVLFVAYMLLAVTLSTLAKDPPAFIESLTTITFLCVGVGILAAAILYAIAAFQITSPRLMAPYQKILHAHIARYSALALIGITPLANVLRAGATTPTHMMIAHAIGILASSLFIVHYLAIRATLKTLARRCETAIPTKRPFVGPGIAALILVIIEFRDGWATSFPFMVIFFLYLGLDFPVREIRKAICNELAHATEPTPISSTRDP